MLITLMVIGTLQAGNTPDCSPPVWGDHVAHFNTRVQAYIELRSEMETQVPARIGLAQKIRVARANARQGDIFSPAISVEFKKALHYEMDAQTWKIVMDDNPGEFLSQVNNAYPDGKALSTMPPKILSVLPKLPVDIEYRFVERHLILLDTRAKLIVDRLPYAIRVSGSGTTCR